MKKTLFTLACAALVAPAFAGEAITEPITIALPASASAPDAWKHGIYVPETHEVQDPAFPDDPTKKIKITDVEAMDHFIKTHGSTDPGFYVGGNNNSYGNAGVSDEGSLTTTNNVASVKLNGRSGVGGDNFVMVLKDSALIGKVVNSLTLSGAGKADNPLTMGGTFVLAVYDGSTLVQSNTATLSAVNTDTPVTTTLTLPNVTFTDTHKIMIAFVGDGGGATTSYTISGISLTATPEPATATLSLLALAGLAARRKRH